MRTGCPGAPRPVAQEYCRLLGRQIPAGTIRLRSADCESRSNHRVIGSNPPRAYGSEDQDHEAGAILGARSHSRPRTTMDAHRATITVPRTAARRVPPVCPPIVTTDDPDASRAPTRTLADPLCPGKRSPSQRDGRGRTRSLDGGVESRAVCHKEGADLHWVFCGLLRHRWRTETGEAGDSYQICDRCGRYRSRVSWTHVQEDHSTPRWHPPSDFSG
jgi:hypothetical protein